MSHNSKGKLLLSVLVCLILFVASAFITSAIFFKRNDQMVPLKLRSTDTHESQKLPSLTLQEQAELSEELPEKLKESNSYSLLLCGIDHSRTLADVILYAQIDLAKKSVRVLQIPRDLFIGTEYTTGKINSACLPFASDDPTRCIKNIMTSQLGLPVDGTAAITLAGVRALVDAVGGVTLDLERPIEFLPGKTISAGTQTLNGEQSEWLLRFRKGYEMGDLDRLKVQKQFLFSAVQSAQRLGKIKALKIAAKNFGHIKTKIPFSEIRSLIQLGMGLSIDNIEIQTLPVYGESYNGYSVLCINRFKLAELLNQGVRSDNPVDPWALQLAYPPEESDESSSQIEDDSLFDFRWDIEDPANDLIDDNAEGIVIRKNN